MYVKSCIDILILVFLDVLIIVKNVRMWLEFELNF